MKFLVVVATSWGNGEEPGAAHVKEHEYAVRTANMTNGITAHAWNSQNPVNWDEALSNTCGRGRCLRLLQYDRLGTTVVTWIVA